MTGFESANVSFWWIIPLIMMVFCFSMMRGKWRSGICSLRSENENKPGTNAEDSAMDILRKRYALGEIDKNEYEEKKEVLKHQE
jgi:uncharacterized membrane protein